MHPLADLSAHVDGALAPAAAAALDAHLGGCPACRAKLGELRSVASLVAALPAPRPRRSLVPRLAPPPLWLAPARALSVMASGIFVFAFLVSAVLAIDPSMGGGGKGGLLGPAPAARQAESAAGNLGGPAASAVVSAPGAAPSAPFAQGARDSAAVAAGASAAPAAKAPAQRLELGPSPFLWLGLALVSGALALALRRRLRPRA